MTIEHLILAAAAISAIYLLPFTSRLGKLFAVYLYRKYFFREDIYVTYKENGITTAKYLIRKNANGSITQLEMPEKTWGHSQP